MSYARLSLCLDSYIPPLTQNLKVRTLPQAPYEDTHQAMLDATLARIAHKKAGNDTPDMLWLVEHQDVYTLGQAGKRCHILQQTHTPIIQTDRGGQITWHGTGQLVLYFLVDLRRAGFSVRDLISHSERALIDTLAPLVDCEVRSRADAPGVYLYQGRHHLGKIASLGYKIKHGFSYHGVALNVCNDLRAFAAINPCGYAGMPMARVTDVTDITPNMLMHRLVLAFDACLNAK